MEACPVTGDLPPEVEKFACAFFSLFNYKREDQCLSFGDDSGNLDASGWELQVRYNLLRSRRFILITYSFIHPSSDLHGDDQPDMW